MQLFEYRIVELPDSTGFMPQRGVSFNLEAVKARIQWVDAVPWPAPTLDAAHDYVRSLQSFDAKSADGKVVWNSE